MSTIQGLQILGIRSFGIDHPEQIKFYTPLTLIVGQNGCGKTTIIECLKYITSGNLPPGCGRGASFVHDPKLALESEIYAQVMLKFNCVSGGVIVAKRSLKVTQKAKTLQCSTMDACMSKEVDGTRADISSKCVDFEKEMISQLAVSKPILENVIFCHQEDSNWPLDEGKKVKEKFDAIFNATKYIKCLSNIKDVRKSLMEEARVTAKHLEGLEAWKNEADRKRQDLKNQEESLVKMKQKMDTLKEEMDPIDKRLREIRNIELNLADIKLEYSSKKEKLELLRAAQAELRAEMNEDFDCSDMELRRMIQDFQRNVDKKERELNKVDSSLQEVGNDIKKNQRSIKEVQDAKINLEFAYNNHIDQVSQRNQRLKKVAKDYNFSDFTGIRDYDDTKTKNILSCLEEHIKKEQQKITSRKKEFEKEEAQIQSEIDKLRKEEAALEQEIKSKGKQIDDSKIKGRNIKVQLEQNEMEFSANSLEEIKEELVNVEGRIKKHEGKLNIDKAREEITAVKKSIRDLEHKLEDKKRIVNKMNRQAQARSKLDIHVKEKETLEKNVNFIKRKRQDEFEHLIGDVSTENIKNKLDACAQNLRKDAVKLQKNKDTLNKKKTTLDIRIENHMTQIKKKEDEVRSIEEEIMKVCQGQQLDRALEKSKEYKDQLTKERGDLSSSIMVLNRFAEKLKQDDCCPLCHRDFGTKDEVEMLIQELEDKVRKVPSKLNDAKQKLTEQEKVYDNMVALRPKENQANKTREDVEELRKQMDKDRQEVERIKTELENTSETLKMIEDDEETARSVQGDAVTLDNNLKKIKQLNDQIEDVKAGLGSIDGEMTMDEAIKQQNDLEEEIKNYRKKESELQDRLEEHKRELEGLKDRKLKLSTKELEMKTKLQETESLKEELKKLEEERGALEEELEDAREKVTPFKYQIENKSGEKSSKTIEKEKWVDSENAKLQVIREEEKAAKDLQSCIRDYVRSGKEEKLKESREELSRLEESSQTLDDRKKMLEEDLRKLEKELSNQKERKRNLDDEMKIRDKEEEAKKLQEEIASIKDSIKDKDEEAVRREKERLSIEFEEKFTERAKCSGSSKTISEEVKKLQAELRRKEIRDAEKNYKQKFIEKKCTDVALDDLNKYFKALDTAIRRFHSDKMKIINGIIRELWRTTYKGNDIDYIEIKADESESAGADKKQTYHYRVVMVKNGTDMDMRTRCSAGQKVLASLIIRMALAETFSSNCGILALDEPTTNLDSENVEALAQALLNIVEKRKSQKTFQLIVITHDQEFLQKIAMREHTDFYYKVSRNERGLSQIKKHKVDSLT